MLWTSNLNWALILLVAALPVAIQPGILGVMVAAACFTGLLWQKLPSGKTGLRAFWGRVFESFAVMASMSLCLLLIGSIENHQPFQAGPLGRYAFVHGYGFFFFVISFVVTLGVIEVKRPRSPSTDPPPPASGAASP